MKGTTATFSVLAEKTGEESLTQEAGRGEAKPRKGQRGTQGEGRRTPATPSLSRTGLPDDPSGELAEPESDGMELLPGDRSGLEGGLGRLRQSDVISNEAGRLVVLA